MPAQPTVAVFTKNLLNPAYHAARVGADRTAARLGAKTLHFVPQRADDIWEQIALIAQALEIRPDAFVLTPVHDSAVDDAIAQVRAAGIPVINIINRLRHREHYVSFVGSDDFAIGTRISERLFRHIGDRGIVAVLEGVPGAVTNQERLRGFHDAARRHAGIRVGASRVGNFLQEDGRRAMAEILRECPRIDGVFAANHCMAFGAIEALEEAHRESTIVGVNSTPDAISAIKSGKLLATADFDAMKIACIATEAAVRVIRGLPVPREILLPVEIIDRDNYAAWDCPIEERESPDWSAAVSG